MAFQDAIKKYQAIYESEVGKFTPIQSNAFQQSQQPEPQGGLLKDIGVSLSKGVIGAGQALVGLANIPTFGYAGKAVESAVPLGEIQTALSQAYSPKIQAQFEGLAKTKGFFPTLGYMLENPATILHKGIETIPAVVVGRGIGATANKAIPTISKPIQAGIGEGVVTAGAALEDIRQQTPTGTLSAGQLASGITSGVITGLIGAKSGALAAKLGIPDIDVPVAKSEATKLLSPGYAKRIGVAAVVEGILEELPQSAQEQVWANVALGKPITESVSEAAAQGMLVGMGMGGTFAATQLRANEPKNIDNGTLKQVIDEVTKPVQTVPMQAEWDRMLAEKQAQAQLTKERLAQSEEAIARQAEREQILLSLSPAAVKKLTPDLKLEREQLLARKAAEESVKQNKDIAEHNERIIQSRTQDIISSEPQPESPYTKLPKQELVKQLRNLERNIILGTANKDAINIVQIIRNELNRREGKPIVEPVKFARAFVEKYPLKGQIAKTLANAPLDQLPDILASQMEKKGATSRDYAPILAKMYSDLTDGRDIKNHRQYVFDQSIAAMRNAEEAPTQGRIENIQGVLTPVPNLTKEQQRKRMDATLAAQEDMFARAPGQVALGTNIPPIETNLLPVTEKLNAVQKRSTKKAVLREVPEISGAVEQRNAEKHNSTEKSNQAIAKSAEKIKLADEHFSADKINEYKTVKFKSKEKLISMRIDDFLALAKKLTSPSKSKTTRVENLLAKGEQFSDLPYLMFDTENNVAVVKGHEGRHRALALKKAGYTHMPVVLKGDIRWSEQDDKAKFDYKEIPSYFRSEEGVEIPFPVTRKTATLEYENAQIEEANNGRRVVNRSDKRSSDNGRTSTGVSADISGNSGRKTSKRTASPTAVANKTVVVEGKTSESNANIIKTRKRIPNLVKVEIEAYENLKREPVKLTDSQHKALENVASEAARARLAEQLLTIGIKRAQKKFIEQQVNTLTNIALMEFNTIAGQKENIAAKNYLDSLPDQQLVALARSKAKTELAALDKISGLINDVKLNQKETAIKLAKQSIENEQQAAKTVEVLKQNLNVIADKFKTKADELKWKQEHPNSKLTKEIVDAWVKLSENFDNSAVTEKVKQELKYDPHNQASLAQVLVEHFGENMLRAIATGRVKIARTNIDLAAMVGSLELRKYFNQGLYDKSTDTVYFVAEHIHKTAQGYDALSLALHEIGEHAGMRNLLGNKNYTQLIQQISKSMRVSTPKTQFDKDVSSAKKKLMAHQQNKPHEVLAYMIQHTPDSSGLQRMWTAIKAFAVRFGLINNTTLDAKTMRYLAEGATIKWLSSSPLPQGDEFEFSQVSDIAVIKAFKPYVDVTRAASQLKTKIEQQNLSEVSGKLFKTILAWADKHHIATQFDKWMNGGIGQLTEADTVQESVTARINQLFNEPYHQLERLETKNPSQYKLIQEMMAATELKIDPRKDWAGHTHLHELKGHDLELAKKYVAEYRQKWGRMSLEAQKIYNVLSKMNTMVYMAEMATTLYNIVQANPTRLVEIDTFKVNPALVFRQNPLAHGSVDKAYNYWKNTLNTYLTITEDFLLAQRNTLPQKPETDPDVVKALKTALKHIADDKIKRLIRAQIKTNDAHLSEEQKKIINRITPLEMQVRAIKDVMATFNHAPYFHLGRFGDHFVSFRVKTDENGYANREAMAHVQRTLTTLFPDITIREDATDPHIFARFESANEAQAFVDELRKLQAQGYLIPSNTTNKQGDNIGEIRSGVRKDFITGYHTAGPNWLQRVIETISAENIPNGQQVIASIRALYLDSLPDTAAIKIEQRREGRPGWYKDMVRNYAHRMRIGGNRIGTLAAEPIRTKAFAAMNAALKEAETNPKLSQLEKQRLTAVVEELERRNSDRILTTPTPNVDLLRAVNHAYFLGMSPAYVLTQITQLGVLTWPELAKKYGYVKSFEAIKKNTPIAFKILNVVIAEGYKNRGIRGAAELVITPETLEKAGLAPDVIEFLTTLQADNRLDLGSAARAIGQVAEGEKGAEVLKLASMAGYASEMVTRIITALAARDLHGVREDTVKYAENVIDESMFNYNHTNIGRMTGKKGIIGAVTPIMLSFMQYQFQLLSKLYREIKNAVVEDPTIQSAAERAAKRKEAQRFLSGHLGAMLLLAGTLGLPFATVIARLIDELCELSEDYCDSKIALRNATADIFGKNIEPLISRGILSRVFGIDISTRVGEADILPFSQFIADRRNFEDRFKDLAWKSWGAPSSMVGQWLTAYEKMAQGDYIGGLQQGVPTVIKGVVKAYQMTEKGYVDRAGNALPMEAGAWDIMVQAFGLTPSEVADYNEAKFAQIKRTGVLVREAAMIRSKLAAALENQDLDESKKWFKRAMEYDTEHPDTPILTRLNDVLTQRAKTRTFAQNLSVPLGTNIRDLETVKFTSFLSMRQ